MDLLGDTTTSWHMAKMIMPKMIILLLVKLVILYVLLVKSIILL